MTLEMLEYLEVMVRPGLILLRYIPGFTIFLRIIEIVIVLGNVTDFSSPFFYLYLLLY